MRNDISSYTQVELETLYETQERFKDLLRSCPHHGLLIWLQVQIFYNGLNNATKQMFNVAIRGTLNNKMPEVAQELFEEMAMHNYQWCTSRAKPSKLAYVYDVDVVTTLEVQVEALSRKIYKLPII